jgi:hypothetical protein
VRQKLKELGLNDEYHFVEDCAADTPNKPYGYDTLCFDIIFLHATVIQLMKLKKLHFQKELNR